MGRWSQLSPLGTNPGLGATPTPLDPVRRLCGDDQRGAQAGLEEGLSQVLTCWGDRDLASGVMWGQTHSPPPFSLVPQILFDQAQRSVRQQLHNFVKE